MKTPADAEGTEAAAAARQGGDGCRMGAEGRQLPIWTATALASPCVGGAAGDPSRRGLGGAAPRRRGRGRLRLPPRVGFQTPRKFALGAGAQVRTGVQPGNLGFIARVAAAAATATTTAEAPPPTPRLKLLCSAPTASTLTPSSSSRGYRPLLRIRNRARILNTRLFWQPGDGHRRDGGGVSCGVYDVRGSGCLPRAAGGVRRLRMEAANKDPGRGHTLCSQRDGPDRAGSDGIGKDGRFCAACSAGST